MNENNEIKVPTPEANPEIFPTEKEIIGVLENILQGKEYKILRKKENASGISMIEFEVVFENGEKVEYNYQKAEYDYRNPGPEVTEAGRIAASISATFYDSDGIPISGETVANYLGGGNWRYTSDEEFRGVV